MRIIFALIAVLFAWNAIQGNGDRVLLAISAVGFAMAAATAHAAKKLKS